MDSDRWWLVVGFVGQALFAGRFLAQWIHSERLRRSAVPIAFWYLSVCGGAVLLAYALHLADPVFIVGQSLGLFIYLRNLWLIQAQRAADGDARPDAPA